MKTLSLSIAMMGWMLFANCMSAQELKGEWKNQLKSTLTITVVDEQSGLIKGRYKSPEGTRSEDYDLVGWVNRKPLEEGKHQVTVITFCVRWGIYGSVTAWTGYYELVDGTPRIITVWHLSRPVTNYSYEHVMTGSDVFLPVAK